MTSSGFDRNYIRFREACSVLHCVDEVDDLNELDAADDESLLSEEDDLGHWDEVSLASTTSTTSSTSMTLSSVGSSQLMLNKGSSKHQLLQQEALKQRQDAARALKKQKKRELKKRLRDKLLNKDKPERPCSRSQSTLDIYVEPVFPVMKINHAIYGHHSDPKKQMDVKSNIETLVEEQVNIDDD